MIRKTLVRGAAALVAVSAMAFASPAMAYQSAAQTFSSASQTSSTVPPGGTMSFIAHFKTASGAPVGAGAHVNFSQTSGPAGCHVSFNPVSTTTDANGDATSAVSFPAGCPGSYVLSATDTDPATVSITVTETGGFPNTVAATRTLSFSPLMLTALALGAVLMLIGGAEAVARKKS